MRFIHGAQYEREGVLYRLLGEKSKTVVFKAEESGALIEVTDALAEQFLETGVHDHENFCCTTHRTHSSPHRGCILR